MAGYKINVSTSTEDNSDLGYNPPEYPVSPLCDRNYFCDNNFTEDATQGLTPASEEHIGQAMWTQELPDTQRDEDILQSINPAILSSSPEMGSTGNDLDCDGCKVCRTTLAPFLYCS
jgi:hypothetical protein